jgi:hypothetical protein
MMMVIDHIECECAVLQPPIHILLLDEVGEAILVGDSVP